jgi:hypothetical protein
MPLKADSRKLGWVEIRLAHRDKCRQNKDADFELHVPETRAGDVGNHDTLSLAVELDSTTTMPRVCPGGKVLNISPADANPRIC